MNLYLLQASKTPRGGYDFYWGAVVVAPDEATARTIHPDGQQRWDGSRWSEPTPEWELPSLHPRVEPWTFRTWVRHPDEVEVTQIGVAAPEYASGAVLLTDYREG